jgi:hypothetical protein
MVVRKIFDHFACIQHMSNILNLESSLRHALDRMNTKDERLIRHSQDLSDSPSLSR